MTLLAIKRARIFGDTALSNREIDIAELVAEGKANKEVAEILFVTEKTVKFHLTNIYKKLKIKSRAQLVLASLKYKHNLQPETERAIDQAIRPTLVIPLHKLPEGNA